MNYLTVMGSSINKIFCNCYSCGKKFVWLKAYEQEKGIYITICAKCKKTNTYDEKEEIKIGRILG